MIPRRWIILGLLFLASVINFIDRQSLSILARTIQDDLHITDLGYAQVVQLFLFAYMLSFLVAGWVTDRREDPHQTQRAGQAWILDRRPGPLRLCLR
jgi:MFS family permease